MDVILHASRRVFEYLNKCVADKQPIALLQGGRRAGKTYNIAIWLLIKALQGDKVVVASMTQTQGKDGAYADFTTIIDNANLKELALVLKSPREIRTNGNNGVVIFKSFLDSETAKGIACDWLLINEGNKFSYQQYTDLTCNVRKMTIVDYNPNIKFWATDLKVKPLIMTWKENPYLTEIQRKWFADLKDKAESPNATSADIYYYRVYYLGEYAETDGAIFTRANIRTTYDLTNLYHFAIFCDPSALRGSDYFACMLTALRIDGSVVLLDWYSPNIGSREDIVRQIIKWQKEYDVAEVLVETNGIIGIDFFEFAQKSEVRDLLGWYSKGNKFERILANYQNLTNNFFISEKIPNIAELYERITTFSKKCEHDDDIDAINSSYTMQKFREVQLR